MAALFGAALEVLSAMPGEDISVETLIPALKGLLGVEQQRDLVKAQLAMRKRRPGESIAELAHDIRCAVRIAYYELDASAQEKLALDQFIRAM